MSSSAAQVTRTQDTFTLFLPILPLQDNAKVRRSLRILDETRCRECHKIGVIYVGPVSPNLAHSRCHALSTPFHAFARLSMSCQHYRTKTKK